MNLKQLYIFGMENSQEPVIKNPVLRAALEGPSITAQEPRNMYSQGQLVRNTVDGSRPGYNGKPGQPRKFDLEAVEKAINSANSKFKYTNLDDLAKQIDGVSSASHLEGIIKRQSLPKLDSHAIKAEKAFIELFKDSTRNADEVIKPLHKIAEMMGMYEGKERVRIDSITNALKKSKVLNYAEDVKPLINKLSSANFIIKIENAKKKKEPWRIKDVQSSIRTKSHLKAPKTDAENLMNYVVRHQDQAGKDAVFNIFDKKSGEIITDKSQIDSYHDIIFKDSKGKPYDMDYLLRNGKTDPMFKEYFDIQEKLKDMQGKKHWPDGSKIIDHTGKHVTFGNYSGSMYTHGYGYKKPYARFPYETDHIDLKKHPFKNLTILPQRINVAIGAADRLKKPDIKYKIGGEHFRNLSIDDLMMQEKALGEKILIFDAEGNHIGKKLKTPYSAAKIKATSDIKNKANDFLKKAGFNIDKCLSSGGRVKLQGGGGVNTCIRGVIEAEQKSAMKGNKISKAKFGKFGKFARTAGWFLGAWDVPIELAFALPHMLQGDKEAAKRATTAGLLGWGEKKLDEVKADSPEAYKYAKHVKDNKDWVDAWFSEQDADQNLEVLKNVPEESQVEKRALYTNQKTKAIDTMAQIQEGYVGYVDEEGNFDPLGGAEGKTALQDYLREDVKKKSDLGLTISDTPLIGDYNMAPYKGGDPITNVKQYIEQKNEPYWKAGLEHAAEEAGVADLYDTFMQGANNKDPRDLYSELPLEYASGLGNLEKQEMLEGLKRKGKFMTKGFKDELEAQGIDWKEAYDTGRAQGGIMNLKKKKW